MSDCLVPTLCTIAGRTQDTADVFTLSIDPPDGDFPFEPGQFNMLYIPGVGESAISISGRPAEAHRLVHTIRAVGDVTRLLGIREARERIGVRGPFGTGWPMAHAAGKHVVLVAGGIGLAPLRPVIYAIADRRDEYGDVTLLYGARTPRDVLFYDELLEWKRAGVLDVIVTVDAAGSDWNGDVGVVTNLVGRIHSEPAAIVAMMCGPEIMMRSAARALLDIGVDEANIAVSMERNMKCATAFCGHCQIGPYFVCKDGPVFFYPDIAPYWHEREF